MVSYQMYELVLVKKTQQVHTTYAIAEQRTNCNPHHHRSRSRHPAVMFLRRVDNISETGWAKRNQVPRSDQGERERERVV